MENTQGSWTSMFSSLPAYFWGDEKKEPESELSEDDFEQVDSYGSYGSSARHIARGCIFPLIPEEIVSLILSFLPFEEQIRFRGANRAANEWVSSSYHVQILQKHLRGIPKKVNDLTLATLKTECMEFKKTYKYSDTLIKNFGGITNILGLRVFQIEANPNYSNYFEELEMFVHSDAFEAMPNIFRCRFESSPNVELIVMKYTLFLPKETIGTAQDSIWHDYFVLRPCPVAEDHLMNANFQFAEIRRIHGYPLLENVLNSSAISYTQKKTMTSASGIRVRNDNESNNNKHEIGKEIEKFRRFINNEFCPLFDLNENTKPSNHYPFCILASSEDLGNYSLKDINVYEDLPIKLGQVSVEEMKKAFSKNWSNFFSGVIFLQRKE